MFTYAIRQISTGLLQMKRFHNFGPFGTKTNFFSNTGSVRASMTDLFASGPHINKSDYEICRFKVSLFDTIPHLAPKKK